MSENASTQNLAESHLRQLIDNDATDWITRKKLAQLLYNDGKTKEAADVIWEAPEIPGIDLELGFAIKVLGKGAPRKAIRLLTSIQELNKGKAVQNLGLANALMHYGMVMQAARFYGAALAEDASLASADLEHFLLWTDDKEKIWGNFKDEKPNLGELPWMKRDAKEAEQLKKAMKGHTTPIKIPDLEEVTAEKVVHKMYEQSPRLNSEPTPPPAVTIPMDRVDAKHVVVDPERGAGHPETAEQALAAQGPTGGTSGQPLPVTSAAVINPNVVRPTLAAPAAPAAPEPAPTKLMIGGDTNQNTAPGRTQMLADGKIVINPTTPVEKDKK